MTTRGSVFIATSVDGFIARADGRIDWLEPVPAGADPAEGGAPGDGGAAPDGTDGAAPEGAAPAEDYGYAEFMQEVDALVMGRATYEQALRFDPWPYEGRRVIVFSRSLVPRTDAAPGDVEVTAEEPEALFERLAREGIARVYVDGGQVVTACLRAGLIDRMTLTRIPVLLGEGIPLFGALSSDVRLEHLRTRSFPSGYVQTTYRVATSD